VHVLHELGLGHRLNLPPEEGLAHGLQPLHPEGLGHLKKH
jgi:hypothetical protein